MRIVRPRYCGTQLLFQDLCGNDSVSYNAHDRARDVQYCRARALWSRSVEHGKIAIRKKQEVVVTPIRRIVAATCARTGERTAAIQDCGRQRMIGDAQTETVVAPRYALGNERRTRNDECDRPRHRATH